MCRDMGLIRDMLLAAEKAEKPVSARKFVNAKHDLDSVVYHAQLIEQADFATVFWGRAHGNVTQAMIGLPRWRGCEFLDVVRDDAVWGKIKVVATDAHMNVTMALIEAFAAQH